jgi:signal transduction histidine kinase
LLFSVFDDLQHTRSATHWSQTEIQQLRNRLDRMRTPTKGSELLKDLGQGMAHDFGNLIDTICTAASVLGAGTSHPAPCLAAMEAATAQARELLAVLQHLAFIEEEGFPAEVVDPGRAVREVLEASLILERAQNIRVRLRLRNLPSIQSNAFVVSRCLSNLVWNAIQALPSGGTLSIVGHVQSDQVVLEISDTGPGISKADQDKIFTPHFSTKSGHSGLGLYLARKLARLAGGDITVASRPGRGSTFAMSFPVAAPERPSVSDTPSEGQRLVPMR